MFPCFWAFKINKKFPFNENRERMGERERESK